MPRNSEQKIKLLVLYELLKTETDEAHPLTTKELIAALGGYGIEVTRKTAVRRYRPADPIRVRYRLRKGQE